MRKKNKTMAAIILMLFMMALAGCASVQSGIHDLPRFTKLMIDGKALYIHRANFQIVDKALLD